MKKSQLLLIITASCFLLTWCFWNNDNNDFSEAKDPCTSNWWVIWTWEFWDECNFDDWSFCLLNSLLDWNCKKGEKFDNVKYNENEALYNCPITYEPVCWEDWQLYANNCFLERQGISKAENAYLWPEWNCIFVELEDILAE